MVFDTDGNVLDVVIFSHGKIGGIPYKVIWYGDVIRGGVRLFFLLSIRLSARILPEALSSAVTRAVEVVATPLRNNALIMPIIARASMVSSSDIPFWPFTFLLTYG